MTTLNAKDRRQLQVALRNTAKGNKIFTMLDQLEDSGIAASARLAFPNQPTTADTIDIGADTYEFVTASGNVADDANIAVEIGGSAALTLANLVVAVNAGTTGNQHANINNIADTAPALANGTENLVADAVGTDLRIRTASYPGGDVKSGDPSIVLAEAITDAANVWKEGNVNMNTLAGRAQQNSRTTLAKITVTAAMITNGAKIDCPFTPAHFIAQAVTSAGVPRGTTGTDAYTIANDGILVTFGGGAAPDIQATDVIYLQISS
jgi:hypothetical protein